MSANDEASSSGGMPQADVDFLIVCLKNTNGGVISVDTGAVAETLNYKNPKSVANRVGQLKKKYDLPIGTAKSDTPKKASDASGANEPAIPATPSKQRVTKTRTPIKKNAVPKTKGKKAAKKEAPEDDADANEEVDEDMAVKSPSGESTSYDEAVFGKKEDEENSDEGV